MVCVLVGIEVGRFSSHIVLSLNLEHGLGSGNVNVESGSFYDHVGSALIILLILILSCRGDDRPPKLLLLLVRSQRGVDGCDTT
jgi:hypothetical protein